MRPSGASEGRALDPLTGGSGEAQPEFRLVQEPRESGYLLLVRGEPPAPGESDPTCGRSQGQKGPLAMEGSVALLMDQKSEQRAHAHTHTRALSRGSEARTPALLETQLTTSAPAPPPEPLVSLGGLAGGSGQAGACTHTAAPLFTPGRLPVGRGQGVTVTGETSAATTPGAQASVCTGASCAYPGNESDSVPRNGGKRPFLWKTWAGDQAGEKGESRPVRQVSQSGKDSSHWGIDVGTTDPTPAFVPQPGLGDTSGCLRNRSECWR